MHFECSAPSAHRVGHSAHFGLDQNTTRSPDLFRVPICWIRIQSIIGIYIDRCRRAERKTRIFASSRLRRSVAQRLMAPQLLFRAAGPFGGLPVSRILFRTLRPGDDHSSRRGITDALQRPTRRLRRLHDPPERTGPVRNHGLGSGRGFPPYLVLLRVGFTLPSRFTAEAVRSYRTFSPLPAPVSHPIARLKTRLLAVFSLWHWPSSGLYT
jgi:hypothetical protein